MIYLEFCMIYTVKMRHRHFAVEFIGFFVSVYCVGQRVQYTALKQPSHINDYVLV